MKIEKKTQMNWKIMIYMDLTNCGVEMNTGIIVELLFSFM